MEEAKVLIPFSEPACTPDTFATELAAIEPLGPCYRLTFVVKQTIQGEVERSVVSKIVISADGLMQMMEHLLGRGSGASAPATNVVAFGRPN